MRKILAPPSGHGPTLPSCSAASVPAPPLNPNGGFRPGGFDTSVLTSDITAALKWGMPFAILAGMR